MENLQQFPPVEVDDGVIRQVLADHEQLMTVSFKFPQGAKGALHSHPHVQSTFVKAGRFRFTIDADTFEVATGDSFVIPANAEHGCVCLEAGELVDCFTPRRDDFL
ncbi:MAG: cupin domain-containing protein [Pseudomonadota bacterium]